MSLGIKSLNVLRVSAPVTNLGFGRRIVLWVAGCSIGCPGCCSQDTWGAKGRSMPVDELVRLLLALAARHGVIDGLTISGGEPSEAAPEISAMLDHLRRAVPEWDVLLYSGLPWVRLRARFPELLALCDVAIPEPFVQQLPSEHPLLGSANQTLRCLTAKGRERYEGIDMPLTPLEATISAGGVEFSGVPKGDGLDRFSAALERRGIQITSKSWG
jgi:anaerobic ribonucleoside-triphosphate reductase activating protein